MKKTLPVGIAVVVALLATTPAHPLQTRDDIERGFDVGEGGTLTVEAGFGSIIVRAGADRVAVRVVREVRERYDDDAAQILSEHQVEFSQSGNDVSIIAELERDVRERWSDDYRSTPLRVRFEIDVPRSYNVDLETAGGNIEVDDLVGEARVSTAGGSLELGNIAGAVRGRTAGGNITLQGSSGSADLGTAGGNISIGDVEGDVEAETSGGSIRIGRVGGEVRASTAGGNVEVDEVGGAIEASTSGGNVVATITRQPAGDCRLSTSGGRITVYLAEGIAVDLDAHTSVGGVSSDFTVDGRVSRNTLDGRINGGGPLLHLRSSAGGISIRER